MRTREQIAEDVQRLARVSVSINARYAAHLELHRAACINGDKSEMTQRRDELHTLLDAILDNAEGLQVLANEAHTLY